MESVALLCFTVSLPKYSMEPISENVHKLINSVSYICKFIYITYDKVALRHQNRDPRGWQRNYDPSLPSSGYPPGGVGGISSSGRLIRSACRERIVGFAANCGHSSSRVQFGKKSSDCMLGRMLRYGIMYHESSEKKRLKRK